MDYFGLPILDPVLLVVFIFLPGWLILQSMVALIQPELIDKWRKITIPNFEIVAYLVILTTGLIVFLSFWAILPSNDYTITLIGKKTAAGFLALLFAGVFFISLKTYAKKIWIRNKINSFLENISEWQLDLLHCFFTFFLFTTFIYIVHIFLHLSTTPEFLFLLLVFWAVLILMSFLSNPRETLADSLANFIFIVIVFVAVCSIFFAFMAIPIFQHLPILGETLFGSQEEPIIGYINVYCSKNITVIGLQTRTNTTIIYYFSREISMDGTSHAIPDIFEIINESTGEAKPIFSPIVLTKNELVKFRVYTPIYTVYISTSEGVYVADIFRKSECPTSGYITVPFTKASIS